MADPPEKDVIEEIEEEVDDLIEEFMPPEEKPEEPEEPEEPPEEPVEEVPEEVPEEPVEEPPPEEPVEEPPVEEPLEVDPRDEEIAKLRETIDKLAAGPAAPPTEKPPEKPPTEEPPVEEPPEPFTRFKGIESLSELEDIMDSPEKFNQFLSGLIEHTRQETVESIYQSLPQVVHRQVVHQTRMREAVDDFYKKNEDLKPFKRFVGSVTAQVVSEHPDYELDQVFDEVEKRSREGLALRDRAVSTPPDEPPRAPAFATPKRGGARKKPVRETGEQKEILDLIEDF